MDTPTSTGQLHGGEPEMMVLEFIGYALVCSLSIFLIHLSTMEGMAFSFVQKWTAGWNPYLTAPLFDCYPCMCSFWGIVYWITGCATGFMPYEMIDVQVVYFILCVGGVNGIFAITILREIDHVL